MMKAITIRARAAADQDFDAFGRLLAGATKRHADADANTDPGAIAARRAAAADGERGSRAAALIAVDIAADDAEPVGIILHGHFCGAAQHVAARFLR